MLRSHPTTELSRAAHYGAGDLSFAIDLPAEQLIADTFTRATALHPIVVVSEGIGTRVFPESARPEDARWRIIIDPLDGTRELMYDKRSAWILSAVAPNRGDETTLADVVVAVQTEVPPTRQQIGVVLQAARGRGAQAQDWDLADETPAGPKRRLRSSGAATIENGFCSFVHYFPGTHEIVGRIADRVYARVLGPVRPGDARVFDDQYLSSGGLLYLLAAGKHRLVVDIRPLVDRELAQSGGLTAHPYDLCTALIAEEAGAIVTDAAGLPLSYPLDTATGCSWIGYAGTALRNQVEGILRSEIERLRIV